MTLDKLFNLLSPAVRWLDGSILSLITLLGWGVDLLPLGKTPAQFPAQNGRSPKVRPHHLLAITSHSLALSLNSVFVLGPASSFFTGQESPRAAVFPSYRKRLVQLGVLLKCTLTVGPSKERSLSKFQV